MTKDQLAYCTGCDFLSKSGEATCDYISHVGASRQIEEEYEEVYDDDL